MSDAEGERDWGRESLSHAMDTEIAAFESSQNPSQLDYDPDIHLPFVGPQNPSALPLPSYGTKRSFEDLCFGNSSDAPIFSSDILDATWENYATPPSPKESASEQPKPHKRYRRGTCWDSSAQGTQTASRNSPPVTRSTSKRQFKRNIDSGVWMGSDAEVEDELEDLKLDGLSQHPALGQTSRLRRILDTRHVDGPVFPYWDDQPENLKSFWMMQRFASEEVQRVIDEGQAVLDLS
ncbi:MAG: hypothetical protein Q9183_003116 [Haloplaca sp. 2 TL-2023]